MNQKEGNREHADLKMHIHPFSMSYCPVMEPAIPPPCGFGPWRVGLLVHVGTQGTSTRQTEIRIDTYVHLYPWAHRHTNQGEWIVLM
jgi:hypothetical protein